MLKRIGLFALLAVISALTPFATGQVGDASAAPERSRAMELFDENKFKDALPLFEKLAEQLPNDAVLQERLGMCVIANAASIEEPEQRKKERVRARKIFLRAKELGDNSNLLQVMLSNIPEDGSTVTFSDNNEIDKIMRQAEGAFAKGDMKAAVDGYIKAIILDPNLYEAALFAGDAYYKQKIYGSAGEWFSRAIQIRPNVETAYRYWGDALLVQGKMEEARQKFIDAVIAEPYRKNAWIGLQQWADANKVRVAHPDIHQQTSFTETKPGEMNINLDPASFKSKDGSNAWMFYGISRAAWHSDQFKKEFPNEKEYRHTLREETDALKMVADMVSEDVKNKKIKKVEPGLATLIKMNEAGLLEAFVLLSRPDAGIAQDYAAYRDKNRDKLRQYLDEYVVPKTPAN